MREQKELSELGQRQAGAEGPANKMELSEQQELLQETLASAPEEGGLCCGHRVIRRVAVRACTTY